MRAEGRLAIAAGVTSETGARPDNQDYGAVHVGSATEQHLHGMIAVIADGVGGAKGGRVASELAARTLIDGFYAVPATIGPVQAIERVAAAFNRWLHAQGRSETLLGAATTLTAMALKGRRAHVLHAGDTRAWHFRDGRLRCLTEDHTLNRAELNHVIYRAVGMEAALRLDRYTVDLAVHDRLLLTSDGVHDAISADRIAALLDARNSAEADSAAIVAAALDARSQDNATAIVIDVIALPQPDYDGIAAELADLPILPLPQEGDTVDGFHIDGLLADGRYTRLYRATDLADGAQAVIKFPKPAVLSERSARLAFSREALIGRRIASPFVGGTIDVGPERRSRLYSVQPFHDGETMQARIDRGTVPMRQAIAHAIALTRALSALHRLDIVHRDVKPDNVILTGDGGLKLIDLGVARLPRVEDFLGDEIPGTPSFMAPEQFGGNAGDALTDQFALGVTLYRWFTGRWPYGEQEPFSRPRFGGALPPSRHRPEIPGWLDAAILKAIAPERGERHGDVVELLRALEGGGAINRTEAPRFVPLMQRNPVRAWQTIALFLALALLAVLAFA